MMSDVKWGRNMLLLWPKLWVRDYLLPGPQSLPPRVWPVTSSLLYPIPIVEVEQGRGFLVTGTCDAPFMSDFKLILRRRALLWVTVITSSRVKVRGCFRIRREEVIDGVHDVVRQPVELAVRGRRVFAACHAVSGGFRDAT